MKKISIYLCSLVALGLATSCQEEPGRGIAQVNPQEPVMTVEGITAEYAAPFAGDALDLNKYIDQTIETISYSASEEANLPADATVSFVMQVANNDQYSGYKELEVIDGKISANALDKAFRSFYGRAPQAKDLYVRFEGFLSKGNNLYRLGNADTYFAAKKLSVTPIEVEINIESAYYLLGDMANWYLTAPAVQFKHSDKSIYDDPVFTATFTVPEGGAYWKIAPQSAVDAGNDGWNMVLGTEVNGDESLSGFLVGENAQAGRIVEAGDYKMTINMEEMTYTIVSAGALYAIGEACDWSHDKAMLIPAADDLYKGFAYLSGSFKFTDSPDWDHGNYGMGATEGTLVNGSNDNIPVPSPGLYYVEVDLTAMTYKIELINMVGMIGEFNNWGGDEVMNPNDNYTVWNGTLNLESESEWKFRFNGDWAINLGGDMNDLVWNGGNFKLDAGNYGVTLDLSAVPYKAIVTKK